MSSSITGFAQVDSMRSVMRLPDQIDEAVPSHWSQFAATYDTIMDRDPAMWDIRRAVVGHVPVGSSRVLDLGCGTGALLYLLAQEGRGDTYVAVDPEDNMIGIARTKLAAVKNVEFRVGRGETIPVEDHSIDYVVSNFSLHHIPHEQKGDAAREIFRVLRPGGKLIFGDQFCQSFGQPGNKVWAREILDTYVGKAYHYLEQASFERMLLQMKIIPRMLAADGEYLVPENFWTHLLNDAGMVGIEVISLKPEQLLNRVIVATKPTSITM